MLKRWFIVNCHRCHCILKCCVFQPANACLRMHSHGGKNNEKCLKTIKKLKLLWSNQLWVSISIWESLLNAKPFGKKLRICSTGLETGCNLFLFFMFLCKSYISLLWVWWKNYFFDSFQAFSLFSIMKMHGQACIHWLKYTTLKEIDSTYGFK